MIAPRVRFARPAPRAGLSSLGACALLLCAGVSTAPVARAQQIASLSVPVVATGAEAAAPPAEVLMRTFDARLENVPLWMVLDTISAKTGVRFAFSSTQIPVDRRVTLVGHAITVRDAMATVLGSEAIPVVSETGVILSSPEAVVRRLAHGERLISRKAGSPGKSQMPSMALRYPPCRSS